MAAGLGKPLMPWQRFVADVACEVIPDPSYARGWRWAYRTVVVTVQRQAGKTMLTGPTALQRGLTLPASQAWLTAQHRQDARDTWLAVADVVKGKAPIDAGDAIRRSNGSETITLHNGSTFRPFAPNEDALHGKATELVIVDEAWAFDLPTGALLLQAIRPTMTTTAGQLWIVSTAGTLDRSGWLLDYVERGRSAVDADVDEGIAYFECAVDEAAAAVIIAGLDPNTPDVTVDQAVDAVVAHHPAAGYTLKRDALLDAAGEMTAGDFLRAYGNWWTATSDRLIPEHLWRACQVDRQLVPPAAGIALGFAVAVDRSEAAITASWRDAPTGPIRHAVVEAGPGDEWVAARVVELVRKWSPAAVAHYAAGAALDVADKLGRLGLTERQLRPVKTGEYVAACAGFLSDVRNRGLEHNGAAALDDAVAAAAPRTLGDAGWAWSNRRSSGSIAALEAATAGGWAYDHRPPPAGKPAVIVARTAPEHDEGRRPEPAPRHVHQPLPGRQRVPG